MNQSLVSLLLIVPLCIAPLTEMEAQEHHDDHDQLHFSHPLVTESPSPDTKLRLDYIGFQAGGSEPMRESTVRLEGEYAFNSTVSLAVVTPFISRTAPTLARASGLGNIELSLKAATMAFGEHGLLLGTGLSAALPTGSDAKAIGSSHLIELEPFLDAGYKRDALELVGLTTLSSTFHRRTGEEAERNLTFDLSALYRLRSRLEALIEMTTERALVGSGSRPQKTFVAPGFKVYPFTRREFMFGASLELGTGTVRDTHALLLSAFYHF